MPEDITPEEAESRVVETVFVRVHEKILVCVMTLDDLRLFVGESITLSPAEYDEEASRAEARADALAKVTSALNL